MSRLFPSIALVSIALVALTCAPALADDGDNAADPPIGQDVRPLGDDGAPADDAEADAPDAGCPGCKGHDEDGKDGDGPAHPGRRHFKSHPHDGKQIGGALGLLAGLAFILVSGMALTALMIFMVTSFPNTVEHIREGVDQRPYFSLFLGAINTLFCAVLVGVLSNAGGPGGGLALVILVVFLTVAVFGLAGRAQLLGSRTMRLAERAPNAVSSLALGWWVLFLVGIIPVVGWLLAVYWIVSGVGAVLVSLFARGHKEKPEPESQGIALSPENFDIS